jgi:hypothetical protein
MRPRLKLALIVVAALALPGVARAQSLLAADGHEGWLLAQAAPAPSDPGLDAKLRATHEELIELRDQRDSIGYVLPSLGIGLGVALLVFAPMDALFIAGAVITAASSVWLITRIVRRIIVGNQIAELEERFEELSRPRPSAGGAIPELLVAAGPRGAHASLRWTF